jgi:hypothetical protein
VIVVPALLNWFLFDRHALLAILTRRFIAPMGVGFAIGQGLSYLPEWATIVFVIFANVVAAVLVWRIIVLTKRR